MGSLHVLQRSQTRKTRPELLKTRSEGFHPQTRSRDQHGHMKVMWWMEGWSGHWWELPISLVESRIVLGSLEHMVQPHPGSEPRARPDPEWSHDVWLMLSHDESWWCDSDSSSSSRGLIGSLRSFSTCIYSGPVCGLPPRLNNIVCVFPTLILLLYTTLNSFLTLSPRAIS